MAKLFHELCLGMLIHLTIRLLHLVPLRRLQMGKNGDRIDFANETSGFIRHCDHGRAIDGFECVVNIFVAPDLKSLIEYFYKWKRRSFNPYEVIALHILIQTLEYVEQTKADVHL